MTDETYALGIKVGEALQGTCTSFIMMCEQLEVDEGLENDTDFCAALDSRTMECCGCGWWCEPCELDDDLYCDDCRPDDEKDEP